MSKRKIVSKKDFCKVCGITSSELSVYISRGKVIPTGKNIDLSIAENSDFLEMKKERSEVKNIEVIINKPVGSDSEAAIERSKVLDAIRKQNSEKKNAEMEKMSEETDLIRLKKQKIMGVLIPTELVKSLFAQHNKSVVVTFQQDGEEIILEISKKKSH
jgi:hypothetical protein